MAALQLKQGIRDQAAWEAAIARSRDVWPDPALDQLIDRTVDEVRTTVAGRRAAYAWSGGKDSVALRWIMERAGVHDCVLGISELEFPEFLRWVTDHMPPGLTVLNTGQNLRWLAEHPEMLFPQGEYGPRWFSIINHRAQARYYRTNNLDVLALGRRRADGNWCGRRAGENIYTAQNITRYSPLADWPHEAVFSLIVREQLPLPPCYRWPRGYQVGTGSWPARQWTVDQDHGWSEVWEIDRGVVRHAATELASAADWMRRTGKEP